MLHKSHDAIKAWHERCLRGGVDGLDDLPRPGRPPKMANRKPVEFIEKDGAPCRFPAHPADRIKEKTGIAYCGGRRAAGCATAAIAAEISN